MTQTLAETSDTKSTFTGQLLLKNTSLSFFGQALPILIALISIPKLIHRLGDERFGVLMLAWMFLGYFNLFDFGLSRALTKRIAEEVESRHTEEIPVLFWTVCIATAIFGLCGAGVMVMGSGWLVTHVLKVPAALESQTRQSFYIIAAALPFVITTSCFKGVLEATQNFRAINRIQIPLGVLFYLSPWVFSLFSDSLPFVISALVMARVVGWIFYFRLGLVNLPAAAKLETNFKLLPSLMRFGGWVTVANIPMPMIGYADRFIIGMLMSMTAVTFYSTPYEIINKVSVVPAAVLSVIFPAFAAQLATDRARAALTFQRANKLILIVILPISLTALLFSHEALALWAGADLADHSSRTLEILSLAIFFNCFGIIPSALLDALGRPSVTAISHLIQLPIYIAALFFFIPLFGLEGAAVIWVFRNAIDSGILYLFAARLFPAAKLKVTNIAAAVAPLTALTVFIVCTKTPVDLRTGIYVAAATLFLPLVWLGVLSASDRQWVTRTAFSRFQMRPAPFEAAKDHRRIGIAMAIYEPDLDVFAEQLRTIQAQTHRDWFCVISMDSEINLTDPRLRDFTTDLRFKWSRNPNEAGVKSNFENAMSEVIKCGADAVAFADQDDVWYPHKLERLLAELRRSRPMSLVHSNMHLFSEDSELSDPSRLRLGWQSESRVLEAYSPLHFMLRNTVTGASSLFDVELAKRALPIPDSIDFHDHWIAVLASIFGEVRPVHEALYAYRQHCNNVVGFAAFKGIFHKPAEVTWFQGWQKAGRAWSRRRLLFERVISIDGAKARIPKSYDRIFHGTLAGPLFFLLTWAMFVKDDPSLARVLLNTGMGGLREMVSKS